jgi:hypothetical protein
MQSFDAHLWASRIVIPSSSCRYLIAIVTFRLEDICNQHSSGSSHHNKFKKKKKKRWKTLIFSSRFLIPVQSRLYGYFLWRLSSLWRLFHHQPVAALLFSWQKAKTLITCSPWIWILMHQRTRLMNSSLSFSVRGKTSNQNPSVWPDS